MLQPLNPANLSLVHELQKKLGPGDNITMPEWLALEEYQQHLSTALGIPHEPPSVQEQFKLIRNQHDPIPLIAPRWWFHLIGLRHAAAHVMLTTPQDWLVLQRRSWVKDDFPGALDVAVSGHIGLTDPEEAAWREMSEEIGLTKTAPGESPHILNNILTLIDTYDVTIQRDPTRNPPFIDAERRWIYTATITPEGLAHLHFADGEVTSLLFLGPQELQTLNTRCLAKHYTTAHELDLASGLIETLPRWFVSREKYG